MAHSVSDIPVDRLAEVSRRDDVVAAMRDFYREADRRIAEQPGVCWNRGQCCRFGEFGHRLYVTALEVVYYLATGEEPPAVTEDVCPHAHGGKCHVRDRRPLGCRIFYCDPQAQAWQGSLTEELLARLRELHTELNVPYFYADWLAVLRQLQRLPHRPWVEAVIVPLLIPHDGAATHLSALR